MAYLRDLILADLPRVGSRVMIGSTGPFCRPHWDEGCYIEVESGSIMVCGRTTRGKERKPKFWQPYAEDLLANDWQKYESEVG